MAKKDTELHQERDREMFRIYQEGLHTRHFENMDEAADWVREQPASRFYLSSKALVNYINIISSGRTLQKMFSQNRKRIRLLYQMYQDFVRTNPDSGLSCERICEILVEEPAPRFYVCHDSAKKAILRGRHRHRKEMEKRICR